MVKAQVSLALFSLCFIFLISGILSTTFTLVNQCNYKVWPGILSGAGTAQLAPTGFMLNPGQSLPVPVPTGWSGRLWGRTFCSEDTSMGKFTCATGDCGSGTLECSGGGAAPPATLAEFTLNGAGGLDFYDVSLVDGYNLPMLVSPQGGTRVGNCSTTGCVVDLNGSCPKELKMMMNSPSSSSSGGGGGECVGCKSACEAFGDPRYCCSGPYATPDTCKPTDYSEFFKSACPRSYSYAYDDGTSTFTCGSADYVITFCPPSSQKSSGESYAGAGDGSLATSHGVLINTPLPFLTSLIITILAAV
ncbi:pathogenesis-related thaumatin-like protein 3.5 [Lycium barbarum]|uniref:pathogenesis-related thaumatin-like protein 3.5 n=1 Tax=Lycium barbarum TaxID=112863 RepID=UPI00293E50FB|nr:pathogenesis-related thaumatin-like protein 3.5 [Lycium barbarum]